jgi:hypothetical protein
LPGSFDRPPRNPAEKINSGYKAQEYLQYIYGLGPALFYDVLPEKYWRHLCKLIFGVRVLSQKKLTAEQLRKGHQALSDFSHEYEVLYYQRKPSRIHFVLPSIHTLYHVGPETLRVGPGAYSSQWTIERTIGNLGEEIRLHSNAFANLTQRALLRSQTNALRAMVPDLDPTEKRPPRGSIDLGNGFRLLRAMHTASRVVREPEAEAIRAYLLHIGARGRQHLHHQMGTTIPSKWPNCPVSMEGMYQAII